MIDELEIEITNHNEDITYFQEAIVAQFTDIDELEELNILLKDQLEEINSGEIEELGFTVLEFEHIDGYGAVVDFPIIMTLEYETRNYVVYQLTYLSCNTRTPNNNYYSTMYIEIDKGSNDVRFISFDLDSNGSYQAGSWGDSNPTPMGKSYQDFENHFFVWLLGKSSDDLEGISVFTNDDYFGTQNSKTIPQTDVIDSFAGSSVTTNNMIRVIKEILSYHDENYQIN